MTGLPATVSELTPGLFRWTAPHPDWTQAEHKGDPDDWPREVGSVLYRATDALALIDPLLPVEDRDAFLAWLDSVVAGRPVSVLSTVRWHRRDRELLAERYQGNSSRAWNAIPAGVAPKPLRGGGETVYWLGEAAALVFGDSLVGDEAGGAHLCPESWLKEVRVDRAGLARLMEPLIELPAERLLVSHGEPVLHDGRAVLARAIREAEQG
jgi:hypothetical protein